MDITEFVRKKRKELNLSLREFGDRCGLSHTYIDKLENSKKSVLPTIDTYVKLAKGLGYTLQQLLDELGYFVDEYSYTIREVHYEGKTYMVRIVNDANMSDEQLIEIIKKSTPR